MNNFFIVFFFKHCCAFNGFYPFFAVVALKSGREACDIKFVIYILAFFAFNLLPHFAVAEVK